MFSNHFFLPCFFFLNSLYKQRQLHKFSSQALLGTWVHEKMCCCTSGASNRLLWFPLKAACSLTWHTDRFVMGKWGETGFSREETSGLRWRVTANMGRESLKPCLPVIHQETNFLQIFFYEKPSISAHCGLVTAWGGLWSTEKLTEMILNNRF